MLEITADDIGLLGDEQLRTLIGRLCEVECRQRGHSTAHVTWGGNQNAADGGIDVRVELPAGSHTVGFIPRVATGFQVKKQDMPRAEILQEMLPEGVPRSSIQELADQNGAYIIVSSEGSTADSALANRRKAMAEATEGYRNGNALCCEFYDRNRVATWVRAHEALIPWVRFTVGRPIPGWQSYGPWAASVDDVYLSDDRLRIHPGRKTSENGVSASQGIQTIRDDLRVGRKVVRLVGLSGVGKTRLVQALFDERVGKSSLNSHLAIYANMTDSPEPPPIGMATQLVAAGSRAILIVDNCPSDLHHRLAEICRGETSLLSLLTVEYDIRDDRPEGTDVFILETSSLEVIQQLVRRRFPIVSEIDSRTIADFSGGNARIALAIAGTLGQNETLAGLTDEQVFQRLFTQRHAHDSGLYLCAQACSLVYSFHREDIADDGELARLGRVVDRSPQELYRNVAELCRRDLVQQRSHWLAILPQAIANRLAAVALQNIPYQLIEDQLVNGASERLLKSFSRRLGYLHASDEAVAIVRRWVEPNGLLADVADLTDLGHALLVNVAPVVPEVVLAAMERSFAGQDQATLQRGESYLDLLRSLAYDPALFDRCAALMERILVATGAKEQSQSTKLFVSLFHLLLSGTHAAIEQRLAVATTLLTSPDDRQRALGMLCLQAVLKTTNFSSTSSFDFGARSRDFGYRPQSKEEAHHWFSAVLDAVKAASQPDHPCTVNARTALAQAFRGLWLTNCAINELEHLCRAMKTTSFWPEGWLAVRETLNFDGREMPDDLLERLLALELALRPADLEQRVRSIVFSTHGGADFEGYEEDPAAEFVDRRTRAEATARELGLAIAGDEPLFEKLLPEIVTGDGHLQPFGMGLMMGAADVRRIWARLTEAITATQAKHRRPLVLDGFLRALQHNDPDLAGELLDEAVEYATHADYYPYLQVAIPIGELDLVRLKRSLALGLTPAQAYVYLAWGRASEPIPPADLRDLVLSIAALQNGYDVALEILEMRLIGDKQKDVAPELVAAGQELLLRFSFIKNTGRSDYQLGKIAAAVLSGREGIVVAQAQCANLKAAVGNYVTHAISHDDLVLELFRAQPTTSLNALCGGSDENLAKGMRIINGIRTRKNLLDVIPEGELLQWCDEQPTTRYPAIASGIPVSFRTNDTEALRWTELAKRLLERAPNPAAVLKKFVDQFTPHGGWSGSLVATLAANASLLDALDGFVGLEEAIVQEKKRLHTAIEKQWKFELADDRERDERFE